jgi:capsular polysaccharide biosynthesis protein
MGICGGVAYGVVRPAMLTAVSMVLLPPSQTTSAGTPLRDTGTQVAIATSEPVLDQAGQSVSPPVGALQLKPNVKVTALSPDVLSIRVKATNARNAERLANAIASDYINYVTTTGTGLSALGAQATQLTQQLSALQSQISAATARLNSEGASSTAGQQSTALLEQLNRELTTTSQQLSTVNSQIAQSGLSGQVSAGAIRILQKATTATVPSKLRLPVLGAIGLVAGLFLGALVAISEGQRDRRLRRRDELVAALGVPVLASVEAERCRTADDWLRLLERYRPSVVDVWALRRLLRQLPSDDGSPHVAVKVLSFADDAIALAIGPQVATFAASMGTPTTLVPDEDPAVVHLRAACQASHRPNRPMQLLTLDGENPDEVTDEAELAISVTAIQRNQPQLDDSARDTTLLAVSSGFATVDDLARLALAAIDSGHPIDGIVVANPDPDDNTTGGVIDAPAPRRLPAQLAAPGRARATVTGRTRP